MRERSDLVFEILDGKAEEENSFDPAQIGYKDYNGLNDSKLSEIRVQYDTTGYPRVNP